MCYTSRVLNKISWFRYNVYRNQINDSLEKGVMSQSKVDKKKYEKKHRKEILRKQKIKKIIAITVTIVVIAAIVGSVAGVKIYKAIPKYVDASSLSEYVDKTWKDSGYDTLFSATASDAEDTADTTEAAEDTAEATDAAEDTTADAE